MDNALWSDSLLEPSRLRKICVFKALGKLDVEKSRYVGYLAASHWDPSIHMYSWVKSEFDVPDSPYSLSRLLEVKNKEAMILLDQADDLIKDSPEKAKRLIVGLAEESVNEQKFRVILSLSEIENVVTALNWNLRQKLQLLQGNSDLYRWTPGMFTPLIESLSGPKEAKDRCNFYPRLSPEIR